MVTQISALGLLVCLAALAGASCAAAQNDLNPVTMHPAPQHGPVTLADGGKPIGQIVAPAGLPREVAAAVQDLQWHIEKATGAKLPIVPAASDKPAIVIGDCPDAAAVGLAGEKMPVEGFAIRTAPGRVFIVGHDDNGTAWGIYEFLERFVGVRWYWPADRGKDDELLGTSIPKSDRLVIAPVYLTDAPFFRKHEIWPSGGPRVEPADLAAFHRRLRSADTWPVKLIVHAPHDWTKPYKETRPEIFQLRADGQRDFAMLCYGNPDTLKTYLEEIDAQIREPNKVDPGHRIVNGDAITVSPNDMAVSCTCKDCMALWDANGGAYGTASRVLTTFVAKLAREVKKRWPDKTVIFLPYKNYTYAPTGIDLPDNVEIQICGMPGLALYKEPSVNASEQANIDAWRKLSGRKIQNWHYSCWPENRTAAAYLFPHTIQEHYQANRDKTVGSFINGDYNHWPRQHISLYIWMKVLWNPDFHVDAAIDEYARRMYGPAAATMRKLIAMQMAGWEDSRWPDGAFSPKTVYEISYPRKNVLEMERLLAAAFAQAKGDALVTRRLEYYAGPLREFFAQSKNYAEGTGVKTLDAYQAPQNPVIDGKLDDEAWKGVEPVTFVRALDKQHPEANYPTALRAVWTRDGVTFGFRMTEPETDKLKRDIGRDTRDGSLMWWNDNVELFLDVTGQQVDFHQFIVNANGAIYDAHGKDTSWDSKGVKTAAFLGDGFWSLEVYIPYSTFEKVAAPNTGVIWYGNFTRHRVTDGTAREYQRLNTTFTGPSNDQNAFGKIRFIER